MEKDKPHKHLAHLPAFADSPIVFFTVVTDNRRKRLATAIAHDILHGLWQRSAEANGWYVGDYVLMPDHLHLFARATRDADPMRDWIKMWKSVSARQLIKSSDAPPPVWQSDYFDRYLRSSESYAEKWHYVRNNPVRAGLVENAEAWPYQGQIHSLQF